MKNLLSYCGLVDARIRASNKDLPVQYTYLTCIGPIGQTVYTDIKLWPTVTTPYKLIVIKDTSKLALLFILQRTQH